MPITVTATPTGASGTLLRLLVLTGATEAGGATATASPTTTGAVSITPNFSSSFIAWSLNDYFSHTAFTPLANNTILDNIATTGGTQMGSGYYSATTTSGVAVSVGATLHAGDNGTIAAYEIPPSGGSTPAIDASSPAAVSATSGTAALTTAGFTPPFGSVLVAVVVGANFGTGWTVTDSAHLTWAKRVDNGDGDQIWTATVPAFLVLQSASGTSSTTGAITCTLPSSTTAGSTLVAVLAGNGSTSAVTISGVTLGGSAGNWALAFNEPTFANTQRAEFWTDVNCAGGQTSVVISLTGGSGTRLNVGFVMEISGVSTTSPLDVTKGTIGTGSSPSTGTSASTAQASEIVVGACVGDAVSAPTLTVTSAGFTVFTQVSNGGLGLLCCYKVVTVTGTQTINFSSASVAYAVGLITLKAEVAAPAAPRPPLPLTRLQAAQFASTW